MRKILAISEKGIRLGEDHQLAKLTNREVELIRQLREKESWTYDALAEKFEVSKSTVAMICRYERRSEVALNWRTVHIPGQEEG